MKVVTIKAALASTVALALAGCGGSSGGLTKPEVTLDGVEYWALSGGDDFTIRVSRGGDGASVFYVNDGFGEVLAPLVAQDSNELLYQINSTNYILLTTVDGRDFTNTNFGSTRLYSIRYSDSPQFYGAEGLIGFATNPTLVGGMSGTATYRGTDTARVTVSPVGPEYDILGDTTIFVNFDGSTVSTTLNGFNGGAGTVSEIQINNMALSGNSFQTTASSTYSVIGGPVSFAGGNMSSRGYLFGWSDGNGNVRVAAPAEAGGAFRLNATSGVIVGTYAGD